MLDSLLAGEHSWVDKKMEEKITGARRRNRGNFGVKATIRSMIPSKFSYKSKGPKFDYANEIK